MNWREILVPTLSVPELLVRGTLIYLLLFFALRFFLKRNTGQLGVADLLVIVLISEVSQNAIVGEAKSATEAVILVAIVLGWSHGLNWLSFRVPALATLTAGKPLPLVENGRLLRANMRRELITLDELMSQMREQGLDDMSKVKAAYLEGDGAFSFIRADDGDVPGPKDKPVG